MIEVRDRGLGAFAALRFDFFLKQSDFQEKQGGD
jgi:hypothetical protein